MYDDDSDTIETAQQCKLEYHIQQARAEGAARVLDRADYKRTNHEFRDRLRKNWDAAVSLVGEETVRTFDKYFRVSAAGFSRGTTNLYRITFRRLAHPRFDIAL